MRIEAAKLSKWYGQVIGVNNLTFSIGPGVTGFLGPNGAGKTTLLRLLTGQLKPSTGRITIDGEPVRNNHRLFASVGYCPENDAFWRYLTGWDFVYSLLRMQGYQKPEARERAERALRQVDMMEDRDRRVGGYSKGRRPRIKLAQGIAHDPEMLILDEPLNGMDPLGRRRAIDLVKQLGGEGRVIIVSSHILHEVEEMTDTILLVNHGRLLAEGNIYEIRRLIDTHPLQVTIQCERIDKLMSELVRFDDVQSVQFDRARSRLTVETNRPDDFHRRLPGIVLEQGIRVQSLWSPDENLEAVFDYLVR